MLDCLSIRERNYKKNDIIIMAGTKVDAIGVVAEGTAQVIRDDLDGERTILSELMRADIFAEAYVVAETPEIPISVIATDDCKILWIPFNRVIVYCSFTCEYHRVLIQNLMKLIAEKNILINEKMRILSQKTTKEKLMCYLMDYSEKVGNSKFRIPFSRNELADYLSVDRSAMSRELGKLRDQGYIWFNRNEFEIL